MEFQEFMRQARRMCESVQNCKDCPSYGCDKICLSACDTPADRTDEENAENERIVMQWAEEHPEKNSTMAPLTLKEAEHIVSNGGVSLISRPPYGWDKDTLCAIFVHALAAMKWKIVTEERLKAISTTTGENINAVIEAIKDLIGEEDHDEYTSN